MKQLLGKRFQLNSGLYPDYVRYWYWPNLSHCWLMPRRLLTRNGRGWWIRLLGTQRVRIWVLERRKIFLSWPLFRRGGASSPDTTAGKSLRKQLHALSIWIIVIILSYLQLFVVIRLLSVDYLYQLFLIICIYL